MGGGSRNGRSPFNENEPHVPKSAKGLGHNYAEVLHAMKPKKRGGSGPQLRRDPERDEKRNMMYNSEKDYYLSTRKKVDIVLKFHLIVMPSGISIYF